MWHIGVSLILQCQSGLISNPWFLVVGLKFHRTSDGPQITILFWNSLPQNYWDTFRSQTMQSKKKQKTALSLTSTKHSPNVISFEKKIQISKLPCLSYCLLQKKTQQQFLTVGARDSGNEKTWKSVILIFAFDLIFWHIGLLQQLPITRWPRCSTLEHISPFETSENNDIHMWS